MKRNMKKFGFTLVELLVVIAIIGILIALLLPAVQAAREAARRNSCSNNFKQAALALHNYHTVYNSFPPGDSWDWDAGIYGRAWSAVILPYVEQSSLTDKIDFSTEYWQTGGSEAGAYPLPVYNCPSDPHAGAWIEMVSSMQNGSTPVEDFRATNISGVADSIEWGMGPLGENKDGMLFANSSIRIGDVSDGTSNTLFVGEVTGAPGIHPTHGPAWYQNTWYTHNCQSTGQGINAPTTVPGGRSASDPIDGDGGNRHDEMNAELGCSSFHPGGCNFARVDGSTSFLVESIDPVLLHDLTTRAGGEVIKRD